MIVMASCLLVNITLTPALLLSCPGFFRIQFSWPCISTCLRKCVGSEAPPRTPG
jgi:hypothetical protein